MSIYLRQQEQTRALAAARKRRHEDRRFAWADQAGDCPTYRFSNSGVTLVAKDLATLLRGPSLVAGGNAAADRALENACPMLFSLLTSTSVGGKSRRVATLSIFAADGFWKASLTERDQNLSLWAQSESLAAVLPALEAELSLDPIPWRNKPSTGSTGGKKRS